MRLTGKARVAGVIGWPVTHSLSPRIHGHWLEQHRIDGAYVPLSVAPEHLHQAVRALPALGFRGINVTIPHKEAVRAALDDESALARRIGAVNTIVVTQDGRLIGSNTDGFGFLENLRAGAPHWQPGAAPAVLLGAGGAARAVVAALIDAGVPELRVVNRTVARAERLASEMNGTDGGDDACSGGGKSGAPIRPLPWSALPQALDGAGLVVNCTSLGMAGQEGLELDFAALGGRLAPGACATDIVYVPRVTPFLAAAAAAGLHVVDGLGMLLHQARPGFSAWFGVQPEVTQALWHEICSGL